MRKVQAAILGLAAALLLSVAANAQPKSQRVSVPFKFNMADKAVPASEYFFRYQAGSNQVEVLNREMTTVVRLPVITKLSLKPGVRDGGKIRLVFDEVGEERHLSEVWFPSADGLLVRATSEQHKHTEVDSAERMRSTPTQ